VGVFVFFFFFFGFWGGVWWSFFLWFFFCVFVLGFFWVFCGGAVWGGFGGGVLWGFLFFFFFFWFPPTTTHFLYHGSRALFWGSRLTRSITHSAAGDPFPLRSPLLKRRALVSFLGTEIAFPLEIRRLNNEVFDGEVLAIIVTGRLLSFSIRAESPLDIKAAWQTAFSTPVFSPKLPLTFFCS